MRFLKMFTGAVALVCLSHVAAYGQRGNSGNHGPSTQATPPHAHGPSSPTSGKPTSAHVDHKSPTSKKTDSANTTSTSSSTATNSPAGTVSTTSTINFTAAPVGQKLSQNTALRSKLETRLQALGYTGTAYQAGYGFKNLGQFVAATNVSRNLGLSFEQLKLQMTGLSVNANGTVLRSNLAPDGTVTMVAPALATNPASTKSLGQSIQTVKSGVDANAAAVTATTQADAEIQSTSTASHTSTTSTASSDTASKKPNKKL